MRSELTPPAAGLLSGFDKMLKTRYLIFQLWVFKVNILYIILKAVLIIADLIYFTDCFIGDAGLMDYFP